MSLKTWTKALLILLALLSLSAWAFQADSWARVGRGRSFGSRGSRSFSTPKPFTAPRRPSSCTRNWVVETAWLTIIMTDVLGWAKVWTQMLTILICDLK